MSDLISRSKLIEELETQCPDWKSNSIGCIVKGAINDCIKIIKNQPPVEAVPVVHGEWLECSNNDSYWQCSNCYKLASKFHDGKSNYCKHCGADMRKKV